MIIETRYVIDSVSLINYFNKLFNEADKISPDARRIINNGFNTFSGVKLVIPSTVFLELHTKFVSNKEMAKKIYYELYYRIKECPDIEVKPLEREVVEHFIAIDNSIVDLEHNDKLILAAAIQLQCPIITIDPKIVSYVKKTKIITVIQ
ncbi:MAG: PIN domain-containing protein [Flavobacterium sp.]|nr:PIN domain-containing protein [Bacteroidota bacterium]MBK8364975.1 PIN domain-containing protein [Bacteroidota bacterium]MBK9414342.1 PIN domain-containing protein [Bacteroidota bacterium]MBP6584953.1 PIN domain-containing protein [Flavobacterium sp.]MBP9888594.1 PIN domain-containing protein [Leptospiraceae bacterium]